MIMRNHNFNLYLSHVDLKTYKNTRKIPRKPGEVKAVIGNPPEDYYDQVLFNSHLYLYIKDVTY